MEDRIKIRLDVATTPSQEVFRINSYIVLVSVK
jgi:hypothetical protein